MTKLDIDVCMMKIYKIMIILLFRYTPDTEVSSNGSNCDTYYDEKNSPKQCVQHNYNKITYSTKEIIIITIIIIT